MRVIAESDWDPVSLRPVGRARNRLERREGINRPEGGQGRPWTSWTSCEFMLSQNSRSSLYLSIYLFIYYFLFMCVVQYGVRL